MNLANQADALGDDISDVSEDLIPISLADSFDDYPSLTLQIAQSDDDESDDEELATYFNNAELKKLSSPRRRLTPRKTEFVDNGARVAVTANPTTPTRGHRRRKSRGVEECKEEADDISASYYRSEPRDAAPASPKKRHRHVESAVFENIELVLDWLRCAPLCQPKVHVNATTPITSNRRALFV